MGCVFHALVHRWSVESSFGAQIKGPKICSIHLETDDWPIHHYLIDFHNDDDGDDDEKK